MSRIESIVRRIVAIAIVLSSVSPAFAAVQDRGQQSCLNTLNLDGAKVGEQQGKQILACLKSGGKGTLTTSAEACVASASEGKLAEALAKTLADEAARCSVVPGFAYPGGATTNSAARVGRQGGLADLFGSPLDVGLLPCATSPAGCRCQFAAAQASESVAKASWKTFVKCKKGVLAAGAASSADLERCVNDEATPSSIAADPKGKIAKAVTKLAASLGKKCGAPGAADAFLHGTCASLSGSELAACIDERVLCRACQSINGADALDVDCDAFDDGLANESCPSAACDDGFPCTVDSYAGGACTHTPADAGSVCRPSVDVCDPEEACDGTSTTCPVDVANPGTVCGDQCVATSDEVPTAVVDEHNSTVCTETCLVRTNFDESCGDCSDCALGETCVGGQCACRTGSSVCQPPDLLVPPCVLEPRSTCEFLVPGLSGNPPYHYSIVEVDGHQDTTVYFYLNFRSLFGPGVSHTPYISACGPDKGFFRVPGDSSQAATFEDGGKILSFPALELATNRDPRCKDPDFRPLIRSADISAKGYYISFTPEPGETGHHYNRISFVVDDGRPPSETIESAHVYVNILPGTAPSVTPPASTCGDDHIEGDEDCDCGTDVDSGEPCSASELLTTDCRDLGLGAGTLTCGPTCRFDTGACAPSCGNNRLDAPGEVCDAGFLDDQSCESLGYLSGSLACNPDCASFDTSGCRGWARTFVTATGRDGNLGGLDGADDICALAGTGLGDGWKAWLSTSSVDARSRIPAHEYRLVDDTTVVADEGHELFSGPLSGSIHKTETGSTTSLSSVRTGTDNQGLRIAGATCNEWTSGSAGDSASVGSPNSTSVWSSTGGSLNCFASFGLYCFEELPFKRAFVTSSTLSGSLGGLAGADALCESAAHAAHLGGTWKAWLSTSSIDAADRVTEAEIRLVDGTSIVAFGFGDLLDGFIGENIFLDEFGVETGGKAWTGTNNDGTAGPANCGDWSTTSGNGNAGSVDGPVDASMDWSSIAGEVEDCSSMHRLYCFEE